MIHIPPLVEKRSFMRLHPNAFTDINMFQAKLIPPKSTRQPYIRERLINRLNQAWQRTMTVIHAPSGYGKTVLLKSWADRQQQPVSWLRLDSEDNELRRFMYYFLYALPIPSDEKLHSWSEWIRLSDSESLSLELESLAAQWVALLDQLEQPHMMILDNFESIQNPDIKRFLIIFYRNCPRHLHTIMSGRHVPDTRFVMHEDGEGGAFNTEDFMLTDQELYQYILKKCSIRMTNLEIHDLQQRAQGWFVGVNAYVHLICKHGYLHGEIHFHSRAEHDIAAFFRGLIQSDIRPELLQTLMYVSTAGQVSEQLIKLLTEDLSPRMTLAELSSKGWFLFPVYHQPGYFVFHPMFSTFLQRELRQSSEETYKAIKWKCALYAEESKAYIQAVEHALDAGFRDQAIELLLKNAPELMRNSHLKQLLQRFSQEELTKYPGLAVMLADSLIHARQIVLAEQVLGLLDAIVAVNPQVTMVQTNEPLNGYLAALHSMIHFSKRETELGVMYMQQTAELLGGPGELHRHSLYFHPYTASLLRGKYGHYGVLKSAIATCEYCMPRWGQKDAAYAVQLICMGESRFEEGKWDESEPYLWEGLQLGVDLGNPGLFVPAYVAWAQLNYGKGKKEAAWATLRQARNQLLHGNLEDQLAVVDACETKLKLKEQDIRHVRKWMRTIGEQSYFTTHQERMFEAFVLLRAYIFVGKTSEALTFGESLLQAALTVNHPRDLIESHLLLAQIYRKQGNTEEAVGMLMHAVTEAHVQGYIHIITDEGAALTDLLNACRKRFRLEGNLELDEFTAHVLKAMPKKIKSKVVAHFPNINLTRQEQRVFQLLVEGASNRTIAEVLAITLETAKRHCRHVYHKIGVTNRAQAVQQFSKKS
jgi:LuxR family maltose regulon positive regulatory protein